MSYNQNNPFSRKSSPLNSFDSLVAKLEKQGKSHESAVKIAGSVANAKMHGAGSGPTAKQKARHGMSRRPKEKPSTKPVEETRMTKGDQMPSRKSSSPLNTEGHGGKKGHTHKQRSASTFLPSHPDYIPPVNERSGTNYNAGQRSASTFIKSHPDYISPEDWATRTDEQKGITRKSYSPLNNTGITGLNYSKELQYMPIEDDMHRGMSRQPYGGNKGDEKRSVKDYEGPSRKSSSPLDYGSWANEDATRAKELYKKGDYAHARALGVDEHDADYGKWKSSEAEHGPSRKSRSERLRERAVKLSEKGGEGQGGIDYENPKVVKLMRKARELDERSGEKIAKDQERILRKGKWGS